MPRWSPANIAWLLAYIAMVIVIVIGLRQYRNWATATYSTKQAVDDWQDWRNAAREIGEKGPVKRTAPKSAEPPPLVLMRDHYAACLGISWLLSSCLFLWFMVSVRGAFRPVTLHGEDEDLE